MRRDECSLLHTYRYSFGPWQTLQQLGLITSSSWTGRRTLRESGSSDVLSPSAAFSGRASSWQCSNASGSLSETFPARHPRTVTLERAEREPDL